jgi:hypothetical protein
MKTMKDEKTLEEPEDQPIITDEMASVGLSVYQALKPSYPDFLLIQEVYTAMWSCRAEKASKR